MGRPRSAISRKSTRQAGSDPVEQIHGAAYDWRRDVSEGAAFLDTAVRAAHEQKLAQGLTGDAARVDIAAHSMGTLVTRYYLRFGAQPLPSDGSLPVLDWRGAEHVRRVLLIAPPNNGSLEAFRDLAKGGTPEPPIPEYPAAVLGTFVSLYQMMPGTREGAVVYADDGTPVDLYDVATWERLRWGPFGADQDAVLVHLLPEIDSREERRSVARRYLGLCLARARQLDAALTVDSAPPAGTSIHLFVGDTLDTHARGRGRSQYREPAHTSPRAGRWDGYASQRDGLARKRRARERCARAIPASRDLGPLRGRRPPQHGRIARFPQQRALLAARGAGLGLGPESARESGCSRRRLTTAPDGTSISLALLGC